MASHETEQSVEQQKFAQVKEELAELRAAIKKSEQRMVKASEQGKHEEHAEHELFVINAKQHHDILIETINNGDKDGTSEQLHQLLDVSPGDHVVVKL